MEYDEVVAYQGFLAERRSQIEEMIADAARKAGRDPRDVTLLAVTKTVGPDEVELAWKAGYRTFGENRPQELTRKLDALRDRPGVCDARFDMIGNLQKNKINQVIGNVSLIHSVSSQHLAEAVAKRAEARGLVMPVLLEVNVSGEGTKSGFSPDEVRAQAERIVALPGIAVQGVMAMAPAFDDDAARRTFSGLRELRDELAARTGLALDTLSCGMSGDFQIAVEEGSTLVRLGRMVFDRGFDLA